MATRAEKRRAVQERRFLRNESRWLQKALFALDKASEAHEKLSELDGREHEPLLVEIDGDTYDIDSVTEAMKEAVLERSENLRRKVRTHVLAR